MLEKASHVGIGWVTRCKYKEFLSPMSIHVDIMFSFRYTTKAALQFFWALDKVDQQEKCYNRTCL